MAKAIAMTLKNIATEYGYPLEAVQHAAQGVTPSGRISPTHDTLYPRNTILTNLKKEQPQ